MQNRKEGNSWVRMGGEKNSHQNYVFKHKIIYLEIKKESAFMFSELLPLPFLTTTLFIVLKCQFKLFTVSKSFLHISLINDIEETKQSK